MNQKESKCLPGVGNKFWALLENKFYSKRAKSEKRVTV